MNIPAAIFFLWSVLPVKLFAAAVPTDTSQQQLSAQDTAEIRDIKNIIIRPGIDPQWYWISGGLFLLLILIGIFFYLKKNRRQKKHDFQAHEKALKALELTRPLMTPNTSRKLAVKMADILRQYIEDRFHLALHNLTTREFLSTLTSNPELMQSELYQHDKMLRDWLNHCDLVKFAKYSLTKNEMEEMYTSVADFIDATRTRGDEK